MASASKLFVLLALVLLLATGALAGTAASASWVPGSPALVDEMDVSDVLEKTFDSAYCTGIPRFGHQGEFPYEKYVVFDCMTTLDSRLCSEVRYKTVKGRRTGFYVLKRLRPGSCF